jgi:transposase
MGAPKKADWREERRMQAWKLKEQAWQQKDIAKALGVSEGAVSQWLKRGRTGGVEALKAHPPKGMTARLTVEQKAVVLTPENASWVPLFRFDPTQMKSNGSWMTSIIDLVRDM